MVIAYEMQITEVFECHNKTVTRQTSTQRKYLLKPEELEVISRYLELIPVSLRQISKTSRKVTNLRAESIPVPRA